MAGGSPANSTAAQLQQLGVDALAQEAEATFAGHAIGNVVNGTDGWTLPYVATSDLDMTWKFGARTGELAISKFDSYNFQGGLTFSGPMCAPGLSCAPGSHVPAGNHFGGQLTGQLPNYQGPLSGSAVGSFVNGPGKPEAGVLGNWGVGNERYLASGIFAGAKQLP